MQSENQPQSTAVDSTPCRRSLSIWLILLLVLAVAIYLASGGPREPRAGAAGGTPPGHPPSAADRSGNRAMEVVDRRDPRTPDPEVGEMLFELTCATCHGQDGRGLPHQGVDLRTSLFIAKRTDAELLNFLKVGRQPRDPDSVRGLYMPPRGGNFALEDDRLADIVAHLRVMQRKFAQANANPAPALSPATMPTARTISGGSD
jgi:mono/diheme cytochrome c family protein